MKKKIRKPPRLFYKNGTYWRNKAWVMSNSTTEYPIMISNNCMDLKEAKEIYRWLGRAIAYLEQK